MQRSLTYILIALLIIASAPQALAVTYGRSYTMATCAQLPAVGYAEAPALYRTTSDGIGAITATSPVSHKILRRQAYGVVETTGSNTLNYGTAIYTTHNGRNAAQQYSGGGQHYTGATAGMAANIHNGRELTQFTHSTLTLTANSVVMADRRGLDKDDDELGNGELEPVGDALLPLILLALCYAGLSIRRRKSACQ